MRLLVIDIYHFPRDLAQTDMYIALRQSYDVVFATPENIMDFVNDGQYDILYLGIYHPCFEIPLES